MLPVQCKMARAALRLGVRELAQLATVSPNTVARLERGEEMRHQTIAALRATLEGAGVLFVLEDSDGGPGVRLARHRGKSAGVQLAADPAISAHSGGGDATRRRPPPPSTGRT